jgi:hemerythrin-like domain-containing protein
MDDDPHEPLRYLRDQLHAGLTTLQVAASAVDTAEPRMAMKALEAAMHYLQSEFLPMCRAEEAELFRKLDEIAGRPDSCRVMIAQHTSIIRMAGDLAQANDAAKAANDIASYAEYLHPLLYGLYALCRVHLESEDEAYLPVIAAAMTDFEVEDMVQQMQRMADEPR